MPTYTDPNLDFGLEQELLVKALKESEEQRAARLQGPRISPQGRFQITAETSPGGQLAAGLDRIVGNITKPVVEQNMRDLRGEETRRYDELARQMNELGAADYTNPESLAADNAQRMGIAQQMYKLPNARKMAETYLSKGAGFPETLALLRTKQIETGEQNAMRLQEQAAREREREEARNQRAAEANALRLTLAAMRQSGGGGGEAALPSMQHKGFTPEGLPVSYNPKDGQIYVAGKPYAGDVVGGSDFSKGGVKRREAEGDIRRVDSIISKVEANKEAFGNVPALASSQWLPNAISSRILDKALTPEQRQARTAVAQEAAQAINDIYGAALSAGEAARADQWAYKATDSFETTMTKLKQARSWAEANADKYGGGRKAATPAAPTPPSGPEEWVRGPDGKLMRK